MDPHTHPLHVTCHGEIETVSDAKAILTRCLEGDLRLVSRGPTTQELAQFTKNNAVFVFPELGHWLNPTEWLNELSEPKFNVTAIPNFDLVQRSIKITKSGRTYVIMVVFRSQRFSRQAPRRVQWSQYGSHGQAMPWPSQSIPLGGIHFVTDAGADLESSIQKEIRLKKHEKESKEAPS